MTAKSSTDSYVLARDAAETARLDAQHRVWATNIGYLVHPRIESQLSDVPCIADVGTGTGVWIIDLAAQRKGLPGIYHGLDISSSQFPTAPQQDVVFSTLNILDPIPENLQGIFDVVHIRLLYLGLPSGTWEQACQNILSLLKPGGYVQWEEPDVISIKVLQTLPGASTQAAEQLLAVLIKDMLRHGQGVDELRKMRSILSSVGFEDVRMDVFSSDRISDTRHGFNESLFGALKGIIKMFSRKDGEGSFWASETAVKLQEDAAAELVDVKAYYRAELNVVYARKAGDLMKK